MSRQEIMERLSVDEDRCKYCNSSTVSGGDIYCSAGYSYDMDCDGKDFKLDYKIEEGISTLEITSDKNCSRCIDKDKCAIHDNFNIDYCSDWRCEDE